MRKATLIFLAMVVQTLLCGCARAQDDTRLVHEAVVNARIELKIGGKMKTQYDPKGTIDDSKAIENTILSYEPMRMLSFKVTKAPEGFPFPNAIKNMWTVVYFAPEGDKATRVREVSMGFGADDESKKMREFFNRGNAVTMQHLQKRFAAKDAK